MLAASHICRGWFTVQLYEYEYTRDSRVYSESTFNMHGLHVAKRAFGAQEAAGNNKITELGKQARQGQLYVFTYVQFYGTRLPIAALYKKDDFV